MHHRTDPKGTIPGRRHEDHDLPPARRPVRCPHRGDSADEVIKAQDKHLREAVKAGDASHQEARDAMKARWRRPKKSMDWYLGAKRAFAELPDE